jgi:hypothetical protein
MLPFGSATIDGVSGGMMISCGSIQPAAVDGMDEFLIIVAPVVVAD